MCKSEYEYNRLHCLKNIASTLTTYMITNKGMIKERLFKKKKSFRFVSIEVKTTRCHQFSEIYPKLPLHLALRKMKPQLSSVNTVGLPPKPVFQ